VITGYDGSDVVAPDYGYRLQITALVTHTLIIAIIILGTVVLAAMKVISGGETTTILGGALGYAGGAAAGTTQAKVRAPKRVTDA
jgi:hypothetical protein